MFARSTSLLAIILKFRSDKKTTGTEMMNAYKDCMHVCSGYSGQIPAELRPRKRTRYTLNMEEIEKRDAQELVMASSRFPYSCLFYG
ncbi:hypothetical protein Trydic_g2725 [Trypoxylus dichotomus]